MKPTRKRCHLKKKVPFHQDNALCHQSIKTTAKVHELGYELLLHPPFSPDLAPVTFFCLQTSKKWLLEINFALMKR
jgi:[histone H3]-lysine36 N-dimethyltransferase SETMAR